MNRDAEFFARHLRSNKIDGIVGLAATIVGVVLMARFAAMEDWVGFCLNALGVGGCAVAGYYNRLTVRVCKQALAGIARQERLDALYPTQDHDGSVTP